MIRAEDQKELQNLMARANAILQQYSAVSMSKSTTTISRAKKAVNDASKWINILNYNVEQF